jgi:hypothetical protein
LKLAITYARYTIVPWPPAQAALFLNQPKMF